VCCVFFGEDLGNFEKVLYRLLCDVCRRVGGILKKVCAVCYLWKIWWNCEYCVCCVMYGTLLVEL
jgi:hypothetical protein